jgi:hypothetical protein
MTDEDTPAIAAGEADPDEATWQEATVAERDDKKTPDEPAATEAADEAAPDADKAPEPAAAPEDIWATATESQRTAYLALQAKFEKDHRQIAGHRRKELALIKQLSAPAPDPAARAAEIDTALDGLEDYPEIKAAVQKITAPLYENIANAEAAREAARLENLVEQANLVEDDHPGWVDFLTENRGKFDAFVEDEDQPAWVAKAFAANKVDVTDAAQAARLIAAFKGSLGTPPAADPPATRTSDIKRDRQLSGLSTPPPRGGATTSSLPASADPEAIWKEATRKERLNQA